MSNLADPHTTSLLRLIGMTIFSILMIGVDSSILAQADASNCPLTLVDEFTRRKLKRSNWQIVRGNAPTSNGKLILAGTPDARTEIQSKNAFLYGVLQLEIESSDWKSHGIPTDSSFGFEIFNGTCHSGVILVANGHLGLLRPTPDQNNNCSGDPQFQEYLQVPNWEQMRAGKKILITLTWAPGTATTLHLSGSNSRGVSISTGMADPTVPLKVRLNADLNETYVIEFLRVVELPR